MSLVGVGAGLIARQVQAVKQPERPEPLPAAAKPTQTEAKEQTRTERYGDPLPPAAVAPVAAFLGTQPELIRPEAKPIVQAKILSLVA